MVCKVDTTHLHTELLHPHRLSCPAAHKPNMAWVFADSCQCCPPRQVLNAEQNLDLTDKEIWPGSPLCMWPETKKFCIVSLDCSHKEQTSYPLLCQACCSITTDDMHMTKGMMLQHHAGMRTCATTVLKCNTMYIYITICTCNTWQW